MGILANVCTWAVKACIHPCSALGDTVRFPLADAVRVLPFLPSQNEIVEAPTESWLAGSSSQRQRQQPELATELATCLRQHVPFPRMTLVCVEPVKLVCDDKSMSVHSVVSTSTSVCSVRHSVSNVHYNSQLYMCHCQVSGCTHHNPPVRTSADKASTHSSSVCELRAPLSWMLLAPMLQDVVAPQPRRPSSRVSPLRVEVANLLHLRVILTFRMHESNTATITIARFTCKKIHQRTAVERTTVVL